MEWRSPRCWIWLTEMCHRDCSSWFLMNPLRSPMNFIFTLGICFQTRHCFSISSGNILQTYSLSDPIWKHVWEIYWMAKPRVGSRREGTLPDGWSNTVCTWSVVELLQAKQKQIKKNKLQLHTRSLCWSSKRQFSRVSSLLKHKLAWWPTSVTSVLVCDEPDCVFRYL